MAESAVGAGLVAGSAQGRAGLALIGEGRVVAKGTFTYALALVQLQGRPAR